MQTQVLKGVEALERDELVRVTVLLAVSEEIEKTILTHVLRDIVRTDTS